MTTSTFPRNSLTTLALAITLVLCASWSGAQAADSYDGLPTVARATILHPGDTINGAVAASQPMHIVVSLKLRNEDQLDSMISSREILTSGEFEAFYEPTQAQAQAVADYLVRMGFSNIVIAPNRMLVSATGTADSARAAFLTTFARVQTKDGRIAYANNSDAHIPIALQDSVLSVMGLQNVYQSHTFAKRMQPSGDGSVSPLAVVGHNPVDFSPIYGGTGIPNAAGVTVGIITQGPLAPTISDLNLFTSANNLPKVTTEIVGAVEPDEGGEAEWNLDSQDITGMSGGQVGELIFYEMASFANSDLVTDFNVVVAANEEKITNVSLGECETDAQQDGSAAAADAIFKVAVAQGQTFSVSSGDSGADECGTSQPIASWPADSQWVVAVGGTTLSTTGTTWTSEVVWTGAGGSPSTFEPKPTWQNAVVPGTTRGVPDIAFDADPYSGAIIYLGGQPAQYGGTSLASPIFVGEWARMIAIKGTGIGFAAPQLYTLPSSTFHDITVGNNGGEQAGVGYDFASGLGSIILANMVNQLGGPVPLVVNFTETSAGLIASFTDRSTDSEGTITSRVWQFGDGGTSSQTSPSHLYSSPGTYTVSEKVTDSIGFVVGKSATVTISTRH